MTPSVRDASQKRTLATLCLFAVASIAHAHGVFVDCKLRGDNVRVEVYFDDDTPAAQAKLVVQTKDGAEVARGTADDKGVWEFPKPTPGKYVVIADAGQGHRAEQPMHMPTPAAIEKLGGYDLNAPEIIVSPGPSRTERVRFPWLRTALGLAAIAVLAGALWLGLRKRPPSAPKGRASAAQGNALGNAADNGNSPERAT
ncbi:MAG: hypothetical protein U0746_17280 [Gemmataceae bacterium]